MDLIYETIAGSRLYGLNKDGSDWDIRGVYLPSAEDALMGTYPETKKSFEDRYMKMPGVDLQYYSLQKFMKMLYKCEMGAMDILHADINSYGLVSNHIIRTMQENKSKFYSKDAFLSTLGMVINTLSKMEQFFNYSGTVSWPKSKSIVHSFRLCYNWLDIANTGTYNPTLRSNVLDALKTVESSFDDNKQLLYKLLFSTLKSTEDGIKLSRHIPENPDEDWGRLFLSDIYYVQMKHERGE